MLSITELPAVWFIVMCFHLKLPRGGLWDREERRGERSNESLGIKFPTTINTRSSNGPCFKLPGENKCIKVKKNALKGNVFRWKQNNKHQSGGCAKTGLPVRERKGLKQGWGFVMQQMLMRHLFKYWGLPWTRRGEEHNSFFKRILQHQRQLLCFLTPTKTNRA